MELRHLRVFAAAAETLNFAQAAERLGIAQPAVSQQVKSLELELGFPLFHRIRRGVELTLAGQALLPEARATLAQAERSLRVARSARRGETGLIRLGYSLSLMAEVELPALIRRFTCAYPVVQFDMLGGAVKNLIDAVDQAELDIAFVRSPVGVLPRGLMAYPYTHSELVVALSTSHHLAQQRSLRLSALVNDGLILMDDSDGFGLGHQVLDLFRAAGLQPRIQLRLENITAITGLIAANNGFSIVPRVLAEAAPHVTAIPIEGATVVNAAVIICRKAPHPVHIKNFLAAAVKP